MIEDSWQNCTKCQWHLLEYNDNSKKDIGYGKLYSFEGADTIKYMFVGMNPSKNRYKGLRYAFNANAEDYDNDKSGWLLTTLLKKLELFDNSYFTNIVKCSTKSNSIDNYDMQMCVHHLMNEVETVRPKYIIAVGSQPYDFLIKFKKEELEKLGVKTIKKVYHPSYCLSYKRVTLEEYLADLKKSVDII